MRGARRGVYLAALGENLKEVNINHGGHRSGKGYNPSMCDWSVYGGAIVENVFTDTERYRPVVKSNTTLKNLKVYTHAPTVPQRN